MNRGQKTQFTNHIQRIQASLSQLIKTGVGRGREAKESNYQEIVSVLQELHFNTTESDVQEGAALIKELLKKDVEVAKPLVDPMIAMKLNALKHDSSGVSFTIAGVYVQLDCDQLKHQPPETPIGTRVTHGGNKFLRICDANWHHHNTMTYMANWANGLGAMTPGQREFHGQFAAVNGIHYEGFCLYANGQKWVSFHCYPANGSPLKGN